MTLHGSCRPENIVSHRKRIISTTILPRARQDARKSRGTADLSYLVEKSGPKKCDEKFYQGRRIKAVSLSLDQPHDFK